jgi:hypothetical protein
VVGLALHNFVMAELWDAGVHGHALEGISAWKEALLVVCLVSVGARVWRTFAWNRVDLLALAYAAIVVVWCVLPQHWLGGSATHHGILLGAREDLIPVGAYFFGRGLALTESELRRIGQTILVTAGALAAFGLVDIYAIPLSWWRHSGVPDWYRYQLGFGRSYQGLSYLPQNFVYNTGNGHIYRRLVSTFLSPLATSYVFVVALLLVLAWVMRLRPRAIVWVPMTALVFAALLWTHSRSSYIALALALVSIVLVRREWWLVLAASLVIVLGVGSIFVKEYSHIAPVTSFTPAEIHFQQTNAQATGQSAGGGFADASTSSHWRNLRAGIGKVIHHPQGYGVGNAGSSAERTNVTVQAGESTYTQVGIDAGIVGALLFIAWSLALLRFVLPCVAWVGASFVAVFALALQTDVLGVPWLAYVLWILGGSVVSIALTRRFETRPSYQ